MNWFPITYILDNLITNSIHAWLTKDYRSSGMDVCYLVYIVDDRSRDKSNQLDAAILLKLMVGCNQSKSEITNNNDSPISPLFQTLDFYINENYYWIKT